MSIVLNLPPELENKLAISAHQHGLSIPDYVLQLLGGGPSPHSPPRTGADLVAYWQEEGLIGTRPDIGDSSVHARILRDKAQDRRE